MQGPATVHIFGHQRGGLTGCLEGIFVFIPWKQIPGASEVSNAHPTYQSSDWREVLPWLCKPMSVVPRAICLSVFVLGAGQGTGSLEDLKAWRVNLEQRLWPSYNYENL